MVVTYDSDGKLSKVRPDESSPYGVICKLGEHSPEIVYSRDRLKYPLKRKGPKGTYEFERITWDEAYETIVQRLNAIKAESGPEATSIYTGRGSFELAMCDIFQPKGVAVSSASSVLFPFGSPNTMGVGALCYVSFAMIAPHVTMGGMLIDMFSDIENADLIIVWGANPATDCPPLDLERIMNAHNRGARVVVIDPRRTMTAKLTDADWVPIRPGTDGALALGMCNVILEEELYYESFIRDWTHGFEEFSDYVQHFRPEVVEGITGVPAEKIRSIAIDIASAEGVSPVMYSGLEYSNSGVQAIRATHALWALAGQIDVLGGRCFSMKGNQFPINREGHIKNPDVSKALGRDRFPVYSMYRGESHAIALPESVLNGNPYKIRSLIILGASIITSWPEPDIWKKTLNGLDFLVTIDRQLTADAAYADIVLPGTTMYEIESYMTYGPIFRMREKVIEPVGEARNDFLIMSELASRFGYGYLYPRSEEEILKHVLKGSGFSLEDVRKTDGIVKVQPEIMQYEKWGKGLLRDDGKSGFNTPTGKFEFASTILEEHGYEPLPVYTEPVEGPLTRIDMLDKFPLVFNSGARVTTDFRTQHHGIEGLYKERPEPTVTINTLDAEQRGISNGDLVLLKTSRGQVSFRAIITNDIVKGSVDANMGGGGPVGPKAWQECNVNELTDLHKYDVISGFPVYKALLCDVGKAEKDVGGVEIDSGELYKTDAIKRETMKIDLTEKRIYLDNNATTPVDEEVVKVVIDSLKDRYGNPSSIHRQGKEAHFAVESARRSVASMLNCTARRIVFTGSGSEANNLAIKGIAFLNRDRGNHIITSSIEHPSVFSVCKWLEKMGFSVTYLSVNDKGVVDPDELKKAITSDTILVSIMTANNETGVIQPIKDLVEITHQSGALFHTDAVQAVGKIPVDVNETGVDLLSISGHKFYASKGVGALYVKKGINIEALIHGGGQENGLRAGTESVTAIVGLGKAAELAVRRLPEMERTKVLRDKLEDGLKAIFPGARLNGHSLKRLPNTISMILPGMRGESVVLMMDQRGVSISSGSACRSGSPEPSHALLAMGLSEDDAHCTIRISLGIKNTEEEINRAIELFRDMVKNVAESIMFVPCR